MLKIDLLEYEDCNKIVEWNRGKDAAFLEQWAGRGYEYPITCEQIRNKLDTIANKDDSSIFIYKIIDENSNEMIGTIELFEIDKINMTAKVGRYLIDEAYRGKGYGGIALKQMVNMCFNEYGIKKVFLNVFDYNIWAIECYKKVGFSVVSHELRQKPNGYLGVYKMMIEKTE